ncbi:MAG: hypothetical protein ACLQVD_03585 [Capsulimonadaceae bacterium]
MGVALEIGALDAALPNFMALNDSVADDLAGPAGMEHLVLRETRDLDVDVDGIGANRSRSFQILTA